MSRAVIIPFMKTDRVTQGQTEAELEPMSRAVIIPFMKTDHRDKLLRPKQQPLISQQNHENACYTVIIL